MSKKNNPVWVFFASVKLALITLILLAAVSIVGTLIKQGQDVSYYIQEYGEPLAKLIEATDLDSMYNSWWFVALLGLFSINLVVCSIERLPRAWRQAFSDNLDVDAAQIAKMALTRQLTTRLSPDKAARQIIQGLHANGWKKPCQVDSKASAMLAVQKNAWSGLGVYIVHLSILVILIGAMTGALFGFQAYVFIPEGRATENIYLRKTKETVPLDFQLQNERFETQYYPNGMVKQFRTDLAVLDKSLAEPLRKSIVVNDPLSYAGLTFYLGDSYPMDTYYVIIRNQRNGRQEAFRVSPQKDVEWAGTDVAFRVDELKRDQDGFVSMAKIQFASGDAVPSVFWVSDKSTMSIPQFEDEYLFAFRQLRSVLLLVTKDPGLWTVYGGFLLMIVGIVISFFLSHKRIWVHVEANQAGSQILVAGSSNKHKPAFETQFLNLIAQLEKDLASSPGAPGRESKSSRQH